MVDPNNSVSSLNNSNESSNDKLNSDDLSVHDELSRIKSYDSSSDFKGLSDSLSMTSNSYDKLNSERDASSLSDESKLSATKPDVKKLSPTKKSGKGESDSRRTSLDSVKGEKSAHTTDDDRDVSKEKSHKRSLKSNSNKKQKKLKKQKVLKSVVKDNYLDTMAEESEASLSGDEEDEEEDEDEEDDLVGNEIPDELRDFITDEVVEDVEEEATDVEYDPDKLDEEDLALIAENTGAALQDDDEEEGFKRLRRLKKGTKKVVEPEPEIEPDQDDLWDDESSREVLSDAWATVTDCFGDFNLVIQILKNERNPHKFQMNIQQDSDYDPREDSDFDINDHDLVEKVEGLELGPDSVIEEDTKIDQSLEQYVDPDELAKEYLTKEDEQIRIVDEPERLYLRYKNRPNKIDERELQNEAQWMARRLISEFNVDLSKENVKRSYEQTFEGTYTNTHTSVASDVAEKCELLLSWFLNERWEAPFILYHKRHLVCPPLNDAIIWRVFQLDLEWVRLHTLSEQVQKSIDKIGHEFLPTDILYFSTNFDYLEHLNDVNVHLTYHYPSLNMGSPLHAKNKLDDDLDNAENSQEQDLEYEDDIFGDFQPLDNPIHAASVPSSPDMNDDMDVLDQNDDSNSQSKSIKVENLNGSGKKKPMNVDLNKAGDNEPENSNKNVVKKASKSERKKAVEKEEVEPQAEELQDDFLEDYENDEEDAEKDMEYDQPGQKQEDSDNEEVDELFDYNENELSRLKGEHKHRDVDVDGGHGKSKGKTEDDEDRELSDDMENEYDVDSTPKVAETPKADIRPHTRLVSKKNSSLFLIETFERIGLHKICSNYVPSANEFFKLLEKTLISTPHMDFKIDVSTHLNNTNTLNRFKEDYSWLDRNNDLSEYEITPSALMNPIEMDLDLVLGNEEYQIDEFFAPYVTGAYSSGKRVFNALVDYYSKKYSSHISVRRVLREYYRNCCSLTCVTTPKGEERVEVSDSSWMVKRMYGMPLSRFMRSSQLYYEFPHNFTDKRDRFNYLNDRLRELKMVEVYLLILKLESEGQVVLTVHPLTKSEEPYWKSDQYNKRFQQFYALYKDLSNFVATNANTAGYANQFSTNDQMRQMEAEKSLIEKDGLILNDLYNRDLTFLSNLQAEMIKLFPRRKVSKNSIWKYFCTLVLERMINRELVPLFRKEVRELLYKLATNSVLYNAQQQLRFRLDVPVYRENIICVLNDNDAMNVYLTVIDDRLNLLYLNIYKNLLIPAKSDGLVNNLVGGSYGTRNTWENWANEVLNIVAKFQVKNILVGLMDLNSLTLFYKLDELVSANSNIRVKVKKAETQLSRLIASKYLRMSASSSALDPNAPGSGDHNYYLIIAVSVCRFYLNTLFEITNLWSYLSENYMLLIRLHPLQEMLPRDRLEQALVQVLVTHVNSAGVDLEVLLNSNQSKRHTALLLNAFRGIVGGTKENKDALELYLSMKNNVVNYLSFVCGLGIRKAQLFLDKLRTFTPSSRSSLTQLFGPLVFLNMASFVKFGQNASTDSLDATRIHPIESGFIAEKLCNGSLDEQLSGEEAVQEIMSNPSKLDDLDLEAYSVLLNEKQDMPRMYPYLIFIKQELQFPYENNCISQKLLYKADKNDKWLRNMEFDLTNNDVFYSVLNLDRNTFKMGSNVMCKFEAIHQRTAKVVILPLSLRGYVTDFQQFRSDIHRLAKDNPKYNNLTGEIFEGRVTRIDFEPILDGSNYNFRVEVSLTNYQKRHLLTSFLNELVNERLEEYMSPLLKYDINRSNLPITTQKKKIQYRRNIRHPAYKMWPLQKVITYLKQTEVPVGECCICPMSEWDRLNLVIKTCSYPFNFATFVIYEKNQRVPGELGKELMLQNEKYNNIDQIIAQFCETLKLNLEEFYTHPKFRHNCELTKVERDLIQESALKPDNINWAIIPPNPKRTQGVNHPLRFILVVIPPGFSVISHEAKSLQDPIYVTHKSFKLWTHEEKSLRDLISWWKEYGYWHRNMERTKYMQQKQTHYNNY